jgi:hypothetical protein
VKAMAGFGIPHDEIAMILSVDPKTLRKHFEQELEVGHIEANAKVAANLFRKATGEGREAIIAAIFWLKCRAGWREYVIEPKPERVPSLGKKEQALADARSATEEASDWGDLLKVQPWSLRSGLRE